MRVPARAFGPEPAIGLQALTTKSLSWSTLRAETAGLGRDAVTRTLYLGHLTLTHDATVPSSLKGLSSVKIAFKTKTYDTARPYCAWSEV